jgi:putative FmdB family regulatory protein
MALYEYECSTCGQQWLESHPMKDSALPQRCSCGALGDRVLSVCAVEVWPPASTPDSHRRPGGGLHMENMGPRGKTYYSKKELRDDCRKQGVCAGGTIG